jgi:hypothetical protein
MGAAVISEFSCDCDPSLYAMAGGSYVCNQCSARFRIPTNPRREKQARLSALESEARVLRAELNIAREEN